jgi:hypothetical protein
MSKKLELEINVPVDWTAVTLRDYLRLKKDLDVYNETEEEITACLFYHLCGVQANILPKLDVDTFINIKRDLVKLMNDTEHDLTRVIKIDDVEYGFEPNLSEMTYGAYVDIQSFEEIDINDNWAKIMSILYRPIKKWKGALYSIESYSGEDNSEKFLDVPMNVHFGAVFFFKTLLKDLSQSILKSLKETEDLPANMSTILERSGNLTLPSTNLLKGISLDLMRS